MIGHQLSINAERRPNATAIVFGERRLDYATLNERACRAANALLAEGIEPGDRVAVMARNCDAFMVLFFAAAKIGAVFVPVNFRLAAPEIGRIVAGCRPKLLFCGTSMARVAAELRALGTLPKVISVADDPESVSSPAFENWLAASAAEEPEIVVAASHIQLLLHSSGTTGRPKGAVWLHSTTWASSLTKIIDFGLGPDDATAVFGPLFHAGPLMDLAVPILLRGGKLVIGASTGFDPAEVLSVVGNERITVLTIYPTMWRRVLQLGDLERFDRSSLRLLLTGGEPIPVEILREVYKRFSMAGFVNTYGSTEGGPITTFLAAAHAERKIGSVGKPAFGVDVRIADEAGRSIGPGQAGELLVRSPFMCAGYWERPEETSARLCNDWWRTGDLGWRDEEGFIWIAGRTTDMIITGAENVYPIEVEQVLTTLADVIETAVIGVPDAVWGEAVAAYVVQRPGAGLDAAAIIDHCRRNIAGYKIPRHVIFIDELPRTTVNKVSKATLRRWFSASNATS